MASSDNKSAFAPLGSGVQFAVQDGNLVLVIPMDKAKGVPSASGKMKLTGSTGGWQIVPGTDLRVNVMAGFRA